MTTLRKIFFSFDFGTLNSFIEKMKKEKRERKRGGTAFGLKPIIERKNN